MRTVAKEQKWCQVWFTRQLLSINKRYSLMALWEGLDIVMENSIT